MKYLLGLILLISVSASAQYSPTAAKTRFVNGIGLGTKDTATMNAADTVAMIVGRDSLIYFRYRGYWKSLALGNSLVGYIPYTGATSAIDLNAKTVVNISHLGINTTTVPTILIRAVGDNNSSSRIAMRGYSSDANSSSIRVTKFRGTLAAPQAPLSGDNLGKFELAGYGTTSSEGYPQATFEGLATENWGATARGAKVQFKVTPNTTTTQAIALTINQDKTAVFESSVTGTSIIKTGGTSSQFLKADGSVDANAYTKISDTAAMLTPYKASYYTINQSSDSSYFTIKSLSGTQIDTVKLVGSTLGGGGGGGGSGTVTSVATDITMTGGTITTSGTLKVDTTIMATRLRVQKGIDSLGAAKQATLTNPVTGTGTSNYLSKFTGTSSIGNSSIFDNGTSVGINNITPSTSAKLEVASTTQGFLMPRMTSTQRTAITSPAEGLLVIQTDGTMGLYLYINSGWHALIML